MTWLTGWAKRVKLTIDQTDIDADLANFPVLLYLSISSGYNAEDISFIFDELQSDANRLKIAVTRDDGITQCYVEIEKWDDANEHAWLWVKAPGISGTVNTDLYLYYDSTHADNTAYVGDPESTPAMAVWNSNFIMVQHMRDYDTCYIHDSTAYNKDGTKQAANEPIVTTAGKIDDAQSFDGSNDCVTVTYSTLIPMPLTLTAWIYDTGVSGISNIVQKAKNFQFQTSPTNHQLLIAYHDGVAWRSVITGNNVYSASTWHHVVATFEASGSNTLVTIYVDGVQVHQATGTGQPVNYANITIGRYYTVVEPFKGVIDEVHISNTARSAAWIKASYETGRDHLLDWGSGETSGAPAGLLVQVM